MNATGWVEPRVPPADPKQVRVGHIKGTEALNLGAVAPVGLVLGQQEEAIEIRSFEELGHPGFKGQIQAAPEACAWQPGSRKQKTPLELPHQAVQLQPATAS